MAERNSAATVQQEAFVTRPAEEMIEDVSLPKRMRLGEKQRPSDAYLQSIAREQQLHKCLQLATKESPRVVKRIFWTGDFFSEVQQLFSEVRIQRIETCKGADRRRAPPIELDKARAPRRRSLV